MVPGSTLMYGSSLTRETLILRDSRIAAREAAAMPFPREETTPPVTKTYLVMTDLVREIRILPESRRFDAARAAGSPLRGVRSWHESRRPALPQHLARTRRAGRPHHRPVAPPPRLRDPAARLGRGGGGGHPGH